MTDEERLMKLLGEAIEDDPRTELEKQADALIEKPLPIAHPDLAAVDQEFEARKQALHDRLSESKHRQAEHQAHESSKSLAFQADGKGLALGMSVAYVIIGLPVAFGLIGLFIDKTYHTSMVGALTIGGVILAMFYTIMVMARAGKD